MYRLMKYVTDHPDTIAVSREGKKIATDIKEYIERKAPDIL